MHISKTVEEVAKAICRADGGSDWQKYFSHAVAAGMAMQRVAEQMPKGEPGHYKLTELDAAKCYERGDQYDLDT
jgi:hypothetical protein